MLCNTNPYQLTAQLITATQLFKLPACSCYFPLHALQCISIHPGPPFILCSSLITVVLSLICCVLCSCCCSATLSFTCMHIIERRYALPTEGFGIQCKYKQMEGWEAPRIDSWCQKSSLHANNSLS